MCSQDYYRTLSHCKPCPVDEATLTAVSTGIGFGFASLSGAFAYLHYTHPLGVWDGRSPFRMWLDLKLQPITRWLMHVPPRLHQRVSTLAKIVVGMLQVLGSFDRFTNP